MLLCLTGAQVAFAGWTSVTPAISTKTLYGVWGTSPSDVYAVGNTGTILHYNGTDWSAETSNTTGQLLSIWGSSPTNIYVVGREESGANKATLLRKKTSGTTWEFETAVDYITQAPFDYDLTAVGGFSASNVYVGDVYGDVYVFDGTGWIKIEPGPYVGSNPITGIWAVNSTNVFVTDEASTDVSRYDGSDWPYLEACPDVNPDDHLNEILGFSINDIYVAGSNGCISHFNGTDWQAVSSNTSKMLNSLHGNISSNIIAVGLQGTIVHKKTVNPEFADESFNTVNDLFGVWVSPDGSVAYAVGTDGMILKWVPDPLPTTTTTTTGGTVTTTIPGGGTTTTIPSGNTTTTIPDGNTTTIPGGVTTSIVPPGEVGADFIGSPLAGRVGMQVQFTNLSGGDIASYQWTFGDGDASTEKNPSHVYKKRGTYSVILTVIGTNSKTETKIRENYITVKSRCAIVTSLDNSSQIEALRTIRDANLSDLSGALLTAIYYRNSSEVSAVFDEYPELRIRFRELVSGNSDVLENVLQGHPASVSPAAVADIIVYLEELKLKGSITLQQNIDFVILGIRNGLLLNGLGIDVQ